MLEKVKLKGHMKAVLTKPNGETYEYEKDNMIVAVGIDFIADAIGKSSDRPNIMSYIGVGTSSTAVVSSQTDLIASLLRKAATYAHTAGTNTFTFSVTLNAGEATGTITEAGIFNAASSGIMLDRVVFTGIPKDSADVLTFIFTFTLTQT